MFDLSGILAGESNLSFRQIKSALLAVELAIRTHPETPMDVGYLIFLALRDVLQRSRSDEKDSILKRFGKTQDRLTVFNVSAVGTKLNQLGQDDDYSGHVREKKDTKRLFLLGAFVLEEPKLSDLKGRMGWDIAQKLREADIEVLVSNYVTTHTALLAAAYDLQA